MSSILLKDNWRPLLLATAGHVNHGKSSLVEKLGGIHPDRLPEEKRRGMTLDLGFVHCREISFIDCPGHESLVRHLVAGQTGVDGVLFVVSATEGLKEQSREHARVLNWLGVDQVLVVLTKTDLISDPNALEEIKIKVQSELRIYFPQKTKMKTILSSPKTDPTVLLESCLGFFSQKEMSHSESRRFFIDRSFSLAGAGTICTGTWTQGEIKKGDKAYLWSPEREKLKTISIRGIRLDKAILAQCNFPSRLALNIDGVKSSEIKRGTCLLFSEDPPQLTQKIILDLIFDLSVKKNFTAIMQVGSISQEIKLRLHPSGVWRGLTRVACPYHEKDRVVIRSPNRVKNLGHVIGGGKILSLQPEVWLKKPVLQEKQKQQTPPMAGPLRDLGLEKILNDQQWLAFVEEENLKQAHDLVRLGLAFHINENHFLHKSHFDKMVSWLNKHFEEKQDLKIEDARGYFNVSRKVFLSILEFCDRQHFTFRRGDVRKKFRLPPCSHPTDFQRGSEHEDDRPSDRNFC